MANAGPNQTVAVGATRDSQRQRLVRCGWRSADVFLDADAAGRRAVLRRSRERLRFRPALSADKAGTYVARLIVNDGKVNSAPATVTITTQNTAPVANAGPNQTVNVGSVVQLNGAGSTDVDGDALTYQWSLITVPSRQHGGAEQRDGGESERSRRTGRGRMWRS